MTQIEDISCVCLQETKLDDSINAIETHIKGYREYRANRIGKGGGGTSIHVKDNIAVSKHKSFSNSYCEIIRTSLDIFSTLSSIWSLNSSLN